MSKNRLQSLFLGNRSRFGNGQRGSGKLRLIERWPKDLFDKTYLNILRAEDVSQVRARPSTKYNANTGTRRDKEASIGGDDKAGTGK